MDAIDRFMGKVMHLPWSGCWIWMGALTSDGYGSFSIGRSTVAAHRFLFSVTGGQIKEGLEFDHLCRNRACVNPGHLEQVSHKENSMRGTGVCSINAAKTHCINGHEFSDLNTYRYKETRHCKVCNRISARKSKQNSKNKEAK